MEPCKLHSCYVKSLNKTETDFQSFVCSLFPRITVIDFILLDVF